MNKKILVDKNTDITMFKYIKKWLVWDTNKKLNRRLEIINSLTIMLADKKRKKVK